MYQIKRTNTPPVLGAGWRSSDWKVAETLNVNQVRPESTEHHPETQCRLLHDGQNIYGLFRVKDQYVRAVAERYNDPVCKDSCVEFFVEPPGGCGYFNFEFSGNGVFLLYHIRNHRRIPTKGFADFNPVSEESAELVEIFHSLPKRVEPEITIPTIWELGFKIPLTLFATETKCDIGGISGQIWRANFYKCGSKTSHPHWISWQPVGQLNFHRPEDFATINFE